MIVWNTLTITNGTDSATFVPNDERLSLLTGLQASEFYVFKTDTLDKSSLTGDALTFTRTRGSSNSCTITKDGIQLVSDSATATLSAAELKIDTGIFRTITANQEASLTNPDLTNPVTYMSLTTGSSKTLFTVNSSGGISGQHYATIRGSGAQVTMTVSGLNVQSTNATWTVSNLDITSSLKYKGANFPTVSTQQITTISYAVAEASSQWMEATENGILTVINFFDRIYDIYFQLCREEDGIQNWVNGRHVDAWWRIELPSAVKNLFNNATIIDSDAREKSAYKWEDGHAYATLDGYKTQWQTRYVLSDDMTTAYIYLGIDSNSSFNSRRVSSVAHYRLIKTV